MIIFPWLECRLPVGSSARISLGLPITARATATKLLLAAGKLVRIERFFTDDLEAVENIGHHSFALSFLDVAIGEGQVEIFRDGEIIEQVVLLENEADIFFVQFDAAAIIELMDGIFEKVIFAFPGAI